MYTYFATPIRSIVDRAVKIRPKLSVLKKFVAVLVFSFPIWVWAQSSESISSPNSNSPLLECKESPQLDKGREERDAFEQLRRANRVHLGRGHYTIDGRVWPFEQAETHYRAAISIFKQLAQEGETDAACGYRELVRLLLFNRFHFERNPFPRGPEEMREALIWSQSYRDRHPDDPWAWLTRGLALFMNGRVEEASTQFERSITLQKGEARDFRSDLPMDLDDPFLSTSVNEAETAVWARAVYADFYYPGWREEDGGEKMGPGRYIVSFGIPPMLEYRVSPYNHETDGIVPEQLHFLNGNDLISFEDIWRSKDWYVTREKEIEVGDRLRVKKFEYVDPREQISVYRSTVRFRESNGSTLLESIIGLPFPETISQGQIAGRLMFSTVVFSENGSPLESKVSEVMEISRSEMSKVDTMLIWVHAQALTLPHQSQKIEAGVFSDFWYSVNTEAIQPLQVSGLAISDVVIAHSVLEDELELPGSFIRSGFTITPKARPILRSDQPTRIYLELYGLTLDDSGTGHLEIQIDVEPVSSGGVLRQLFRARSRNVGVRLNWAVNSPDEGLYLDIESESLPPGPVTLTASITDSISGEKVSSKLVAEVK